MNCSTTRIVLTKTTNYLILVLFISIPFISHGTHAVIGPDELFASGMKYFSGSRFDEAISSFIQAEKEYKISNNTKQMIGCRMGIATCFFAKGNIKKALEYNESALELHIREIKNDQKGYDQIKDNIALCKEVMQRTNH